MLRTEREREATENTERAGVAVRTFHPASGHTHLVHLAAAGGDISSC